MAGVIKACIALWTPSIVSHMRCGYHSHSLSFQRGASSGSSARKPSQHRQQHCVCMEQLMRVCVCEKCAVGHL